MQQSVERSALALPAYAVAFAMPMYSFVQEKKNPKTVYENLLSSCFDIQLIDVSSWAVTDCG